MTRIWRTMLLWGAFSAVVMMLGAGLSLATDPASTNYDMTSGVVNNGGGSSSSQHYTQDSSVGQSGGIGPQSSASYRNYAGLFSEPVSTTFSGNLSAALSFQRPDISADATYLDPADTSAVVPGIAVDPGAATNVGSTTAVTDASFNYLKRSFTPATTGLYTIAVTSANLTPGTISGSFAYGYGTSGVPVSALDDTALFLYDTFDPLNGAAGLMYGNDDTVNATAGGYSNSYNFRSTIPGVQLIGGHTYTVVVTSYKDGVTGSVNFEITGPSPAILSPVATTGSASGISSSAATLNGTVADGGADTTVRFDYGTSTGYGSNVPATVGATISAGAGSSAAAAAIAGLTCNTAYHFRVNGVNSVGTGNGDDQTFTTAACAANYSVSYNGNGNTGGSAPADAGSPYASGATVTVLGNSGTLAKAGYSFNGWNTAANGSGTAYAAAVTFSLAGNTTLYAQWTALPAPTVTGISPASGPTSGAIPVTITGTGFTGASAVKFGMLNAASFTVNSATQITATAPAGTAGTVDITVTTAGGTSASGASDHFSYLTAATVTTLGSSLNPSTQGQAVTLTATVNNASATGTVNFQDGASSITGCAAAALSGGAATCITSALSTGSRSLTAAYSGDGSFGASSSSPLIQSVNVPNWANGRPADFVLGAPDFTTAGGGASASRFSGPSDVCTDPLTGKVFVVSNSQNRILRFASADAVTTGASAESVLGQPDFSSVTGNADGTSATSLNGPTSCAMDAAGNLFVADGLNMRVLRYDNASAKATGAAADGVLGQPDFAVLLSGVAANRLYNSTLYGIALGANGSLFVADAGNRRVLRFDNAASKANGADADGVLGQPDFTSAGPGGLTASTFSTSEGYQLEGVTLDSFGNLYVSDSDNRRILRFNNAASKPNGAAADGVLGAPDFTTQGEATVTNATFGTNAFGIDVLPDGALYVSDFSNNRVLVFSSPDSKANGGPADYVLGQPDFTGNAAAVSQTGMFYPLGLGYDPVHGSLLVSDFVNNRVLGYTNPLLIATPTLTSSMPADDATGVAAGSSIVLKYSNPVALSTGTKYLKIVNDTDSSSQTIDVSDHGSELTLAGGSNTLTITPNPPLAAGKSYHLEIDNGALVNYYGGTKAYAGIAGATTLNFTISAPLLPAVTGVSPASAPLTGGASVTITGTGFSGASAVKFGSVDATNFTVDSATQITALAPAGSLGTLDLTVVTGAGTSAVSSLDQFSYTKLASTISLTSVPNPSSFGQSVTLSATVAGNGATGTVSFFDGATLLGTGSLSVGSATFTTAVLGVASHSLTAVYSGDANFNGSTSAVRSQTVGIGSSTTTLTSSPNPSSFGQTVTLTATVTGTGGTPTGTVSFFDGATLLGTGTLSGSVATFTSSAFSVASHSITAVYSGDASFIGSTAPVQTQTVNKAVTTTSTVSSPNPSSFGQAVTATATVVGSGATGTVSFFDGASLLGTSTLTSGVATFISSALGVASHSITAVYSGDASFNGSTAPVQTQTVNKAVTTTSTISSPNPSSFGQAVTVTATVAGSGATGTVSFFDGATLLGTGTLSGSVATFISSALGVASHSITAVYSGDTSFNGSTAPVQTQTVNKAVTTTSTISSPNPSSFGQAVTVTATVAGSGATGTVSFFDGATLLGTSTLSGSVATFTSSAFSVASHSITAVFSGDASFNGSTAPVQTQTVNKAVTTTSTVSSPNPSSFGQAVTATATVAGSGATGTVSFFDGASLLGTSTLTSGVATFISSALGVASHSITAVYSGDASFNGSTAPVQTQTVNKAVTTTSTISSPNPSSFGQAVTATATVAGSGATGTVSFFDGATLLGTSTLSGGSATFTSSAFGVASHSITAAYSGDASFNGSTASVQTQTVNKAVTTTSTISSPNPSSFGQAVTATATVAGSGATGTVSFFDGATLLGTSTLSGGSAAFTSSALGVASHSITAVYSGDASFNGSTAPVQTQTVNKAVTTTSTVSSPNPSSFGQAVTATATVAGSGATGTVSFFDGATLLGTSTLTGGVATFISSVLGVASHSITSVYSGDASFNGSTAPVQTQTVNKAATTTSTVSSPNPSSFGQAVTITATVAGSGATGTVSFFDGATLLGTSTLTSGVATITSSALGVGSHSITAVYSGDASFNGSTSPIQTQTVTKATTTTSTVSSPNPSSFGQAVTITATVAGAGGTPTGTVSFFDGATLLGTGTLTGGSATFTSSALGVGSHSITAVYNGGASFNGSTAAIDTHTVIKATTTSSTVSSPNPSSFGQAVTITATVAGSGTTGTVSFFDGATLLGTSTLTGGSATFISSALGVGSHSITAVYSGDASFNGSTAPVQTHTVNKAASTTTAASAPNPSVYGQTITITATVSSSVTTPTGTVTFMDGATVLGSATLSGGVASFTTSALVANSHSITALYSGDTNYNGSTSPVSFQTVTKAMPVLNWLAPLPIPAGATLDAHQLNATASVPGTFLYTPASGAALGSGIGQTLSVSFTPTDSANYQSATTSVVIDVQKAPQTISFAAPAGKLLSDAPFSLSASASSGLTLSYTSSNPAVATVSGSSVTVVGVGTTTITASQAGNASFSAAVSVNQALAVGYAASAPSVSVFTLSDGAITSAAILSITGSASGINGIKSVIINGTPLTLGTLNAFSQAFTLTPGENTFTVTAIDNAGLEATDSRTITYDNTKPVITVTSPADNSTLSANSVVVTGYLDNAGTLSARVNNGSAQAAAMTGNNFSVTLNLSAGSNTIALTATDLAGNSSTVNRTIVSDTASPSLAVTTPGLDISTDQSTLVLSGTLTDALSAATLTVTVDGQSYSPVVSAGSFQVTLPLPTAKQYAITVTGVDAAGNSVSVQRNVIRRALPVLSWSSPAAISFGTALGAVQLNATSGVAGTIVYSPNSGTVLNAGKAQVLTASFTPNDLTSYSPASVSVVIDVNQAVPVITWANPAPISYGTALGAAQRNATANVPGTMSYAPAAGILNAGAGQTLTATFTPSDTVNYATVSKSVSIDVNRSVPVLTWNTPAAISFGTALGAAQLNASATVAGSFLYTPAAGSFLNGGAGRVLSVLFTPTDSLNYTTASANAALDVNKSAQSISFGALSAKLLTDLPFAIGASSSSALPVTFTSSNNAVATVSGATVSIVGAGTCTITASQAGDSNYASAPSVNQPLMIVYAASVPTVRVSTLSDGAITNAALLNIAGSASGVNGIKTVIINGTPVVLDAFNSFTQVFTLKEGQNTFITTALDNAGLEATDSRTVTLDTSRPVITVTAPADNSTLSATSVVVTGYLDNPGTLTAVVNNGSPKSADMTGNNFSIALNLSGGTNTIELTATDLAGNSSTAKRTIVSDTTKPSLAVTYPGTDSTINATSFTLAGTVSDDLGSSLVSVTMEGVTYTPQVLNGAFTQQLNLPSAKTYQITVTAIDQGGNSATVVRNVIRPRILGDLNHDGKVDVVDALIALQMSVGILTANADDLAAGDVAPLVNGVPQPDSVIDIEDAYAILKKAVGSLNF